MANVIYDKYKEALLSSANNVSLTTEIVKVSLIDSAETFYSSTNEFVSDLNSSNGIIATATLNNVTALSGTVNGDDLVFEVEASDSAEALLLWIDTGDANTDRLVAWMDTNIDGLPIAPDGSNVSIIWSSSGIFKL